MVILDFVTFEYITVHSDQFDNVEIKIIRS